MTISVELLTTKETLEHCFLPWQLLMRQRKHFAWQSPHWWRFWLESSAVGLPYWAVVRSGGAVVGMVPLSNVTTSSKLVWQLSLNPLAGGGVIGGQTTAVLNAVIGKLTRLSGRTSWELDYDPSDDYLKNRFELAFQNSRLAATAATVKLIGWSIENLSPSKSKSKHAVDAPTNGNVVWFESGIGCNDVYLRADEKLELLELLECNNAEWIRLDEHLSLAFLSFSTSRVLAGEAQFADENTWLPCCLVDHSQSRSKKEIAELVSSRLLACFCESALGKGLLPESLDQWLKASICVDWPVACQQANIRIKRWLIQHRRFEYPGVWRRIRNGFSKTATSN